MTNKERFIEIYKTYIKRPGSEKLLEYLLSPHSDFFEAPAKVLRVIETGHISNLGETVFTFFN